ncbi:MAG TPA: T9SS type A sorting domain-containing protein, partial [bacterium]|nr:T9SS type A sorting domain-containing protein [bacterium]
DRLAAVYRTAGVYTTENAGLSWNAVVLPGYNGQTIVDADWDPDSNRFFLAIENGGAYLSGVGFISQGTITSTPTSISYEPLSKIVLLGTQYASVSLLDPGSVVDAPFISSAPQLEMAIHARPNPSRGQFDFDVHVGKEGAARISIVDVRGRRVAVPFEGRLDQGRHSIHWEANGSGASGRIVPGIYFAQIDTAGRSATTRLVILGQ